MSRRHGSDLQPQALRLPQHARDRLTELAIRLCTSGTPVKVAQATRGICLLTLHLARGAAGKAAADAVRIAASDPVQGSVRNAISVIVTLLDSEAPTAPMHLEPGGTDARTGVRLRMPTRGHRGLHSQALRLSVRARGELEALATELRAAGACVTAAEAMRGLCLLALEFVDGAAGAEAAEAFCIAARDPSTEGTRRAVEALRALLEGAPSTTPEPAPPTPPRSGDSLPPTTRRAA